MAQDPDSKSALQIDDWKGLFTNASPHSVPLGGAQTAVNVWLGVPGELRTRPAFGLATYANATSKSTDDGIAIAAFESNNGRFILWETTNGDVKAGQTVQPV